MSPARRGYRRGLVELSFVLSTIRATLEIQQSRIARPELGRSGDVSPAMGAGPGGPSPKACSSSARAPVPGREPSAEGLAGAAAAGLAVTERDLVPAGARVPVETAVRGRIQHAMVGRTKSCSSIPLLFCPTERTS